MSQPSLDVYLSFLSPFGSFRFCHFHSASCLCSQLYSSSTSHTPASSDLISPFSASACQLSPNPQHRLLFSSARCAAIDSPPTAVRSNTHVPTTTRRPSSVCEALDERRVSCLRLAQAELEGPSLFAEFRVELARVISNRRGPKVYQASKRKKREMKEKENRQRKRAEERGYKQGLTGRGAYEPKG
jgi:hypothetical protein